MKKIRLAMIVVLAALFLALFSAEASCFGATVYFDRASESVGEGGDVHYYIIYDNPDAWLVGGSPVNIRVQVSGGNATYGDNYTATIDGTPFNSDGSASVSFTPLYTSWRTWDVDIHASDTIQNDVYQDFSLSASGYYTVAGGQTSNTLYIDKLPTIQFQVVQENVYEGNTTTINVVRTGYTYIQSSVDFSYTCDAKKGGSYTVSPSPQTFTFAQGETQKTISVVTTNDNVYGNDYHLTFMLQNPQGARLGTVFGNYLTVNSTDTPPTVQFQASAESVNEGDSTTFKIVRTGRVADTASTVDVQVSQSPSSYGYSTPGVSISNNNKFQVNFNVNETEKTITVNASTNEQYDDTRNVVFTISAANNGHTIIGSANTNTLTIVDNTPMPVVEFAMPDESVNEGNQTDIIINRVGPNNTLSKVYFSVNLFPGDVRGNYSQSVSNMVQFDPGQTQASITIDTEDDRIYGNDYRLNFTLTGADKAVIGDDQTSVLTVHDTTPLPAVEFLINTADVLEGKSINITVTRTGAKNVESTVSYGFVNAQSNTNVLRFVGDPGLNENIVFSPGDTNKYINITAKDDGITGNKIAVFELYSVSNAIIDSNKDITLKIDDTTDIQNGPPYASIYGPDGGASAGETCQITVKRSSYDQASNVILDRVNGDAESPGDYSTSVALPYTVHFDAGEKSKTVTISINSTSEGEKSVTFGLLRLGSDMIPQEPYTYTLAIHGLTPTPTSTPTPTPTDTPTPTPSDKALYVNANLDTQQITVGYEGKITIKVTDGVNPISGAGVSIDQIGGTIIMLNSTTDSNGICYATFKSDTVGQYTLTITSTASGYDSGSATLTANVVQTIPGSLTVSTMVDQQPVITGNSAKVTVNVMDGTTPVSGASVRIESTSGSVTPSSGVTDEDGNLFGVFQSEDPGSYILTVTASASGHPQARVSYAVQVVSAEERHLYTTLDVTPKSVSPNSKATLTVMVTDGVKPVSNAAVSLVSTGGSISPASGVTDSQGKFVTQFTSGIEGTYTLGVTAKSDAIGQASYSTFIKVKQGIFDLQALMYIVMAVAGIAIALILGFLFMKKWTDSDLKIVPKISAIPADGMSKLPLRVELYNGFGRPKKMRSETYVELEATSGRIEGVTIPAHKSFADAVLTSSKEFGTVTIKAKLGDKAMASAPVEYKLEGGSLAVTISPSMILADSNSSAAINIRVRNSKGNYVTPLADKVIELSATQGNIVGTMVRLAARADSANAVIVSGGATGIATVTASMGNLKGTGRVEFRGISRQICSNCGETIPRDFDTCPACGHPSPQAETKVQALAENKEQVPVENKEPTAQTT